jgi:hypothetical protein
MDEKFVKEQLSDLERLVELCMALLVLLKHAPPGEIDEQWATEKIRGDFEAIGRLAMCLAGDGFEDWVAETVDKMNISFAQTGVRLRRGYFYGLSAPCGLSLGEIEDIFAAANPDANDPEEGN